MTKLLEQAFAEAAKLPASEQDLLARRLLSEIAADDEFDLAIADSADLLARLAIEAATDEVQDLDPESL